MSYQELIQTSKPIWIEGSIAIAIGFALVLSITATDISFHDDYVLLILSWCHPDNQDAFCTDFREQHGLSITAQSEIGDKYWDRLASQAIEIFAIMFIVRMAFAYMLSKVGKKIRLTSVLMALIWGASATVLFLTGVLDTFYYVIQGLPIPDTLNWLDNVGLFTETKAWFGDPEVVDKADLFATNLLGIAILVGMVFFTALVFNENGLKRRRIA